MKESQIERRLVEGVKALGGKAYKFVSPGNAGVPDRLISLPGDKVVFVETKAPGETPSPLQRFQHSDLRNRGHKVFGCVDTYEDVDKIIQYCKQLIESEATSHEI